MKTMTIAMQQRLTFLGVFSLGNLPKECLHAVGASPEDLVLWKKEKAFADAYELIRAASFTRAEGILTKALERERTEMNSTGSSPIEKQAIDELQDAGHAAAFSERPDGSPNSFFDGADGTPNSFLVDSRKFDFLAAVQAGTDQATGLDAVGATARDLADWCAEAGVLRRS